MKKVLITLNSSWNIYNFRVGLIKALQCDGYHIIALAPRDSYSLKLEELGVEYHHIDIDSKGTNPLEDIKLLWNFYKLYKKLKPDVALHYTIKPNIYATLVARVLKIPVISNISGLGRVFLDDGISSKVARWLYVIALKSPKKVFFQNSDDRELFVEHNLVDFSKTELLAGSGIDVTKFKPINVERKSKKFSFLFIARLLKDKGIVEYVEACKEIKKKYSIKCYILGDYYESNPTAIKEEELKKWQEEGAVTYLGRSDDVASHIASVDCVVLPSYREGLSRVLLEASSMAKPIVTTDVAGCRDVVADGVNGFLCDPKSGESLHDAMLKMLKLNELERANMGRRGREMVLAKFDEKIVIQSYKDALFEIFEK